MMNRARGAGSIDVVLFDFGGVIAEEGFSNGLDAIAKANGLDEKEFLQAASDAIYSSGYVLGKAPEKEFWKELKEKTGIKGDNADLRAEILSRFILRNWIIDLVKKLKDENIIVGILSDQTDWLDVLDEQFGFFRWFDHVFNSYYLGKGKRDISIFDDIAQALNTAADRIIFIDDNPGNIDRARQKGWKAIEYVDRESFEKEFEKVVSGVQTIEFSNM
jgi:putative hydrolase of the HAD superfamily